MLYMSIKILIMFFQAQALVSPANLNEIVKLLNFASIDGFIDEVQLSQRRKVSLEITRTIVQALGNQKKS